MCPLLIGQPGVGGKWQIGESCNLSASPKGLQDNFLKKLSCNPFGDLLKKELITGHWPNSQSPRNASQPPPGLSSNCAKCNVPLVQ